MATTRTQLRDGESGISPSIKNYNGRRKTHNLGAIWDHMREGWQTKKPAKLGDRAIGKRSATMLPRRNVQQGGTKDTERRGCVDAATTTEDRQHKPDGLGYGRTNGLM